MLPLNDNNTGRMNHKKKKMDSINNEYSMCVYVYKIKKINIKTSMSFVMLLSHGSCHLFIYFYTSEGMLPLMVE